MSEESGGRSLQSSQDGNALQGADNPPLLERVDGARNLHLLPVVCGECDDAPATRQAWFNGRTLMDLCDECWLWWENHGLIEPRDDAFFEAGGTLSNLPPLGGDRG